MTPKKDREKGAILMPRSQQQKASKTGQLHEASSRRKEKPQKEKTETNELKSDEEAEVMLKTTVVDIDSVREDQVKEENLGHLEAADYEDGESMFKEEHGSKWGKLLFLRFVLFDKVKYDPMP